MWLVRSYQMGLKPDELMGMDVREVWRRWNAHLEEKYLGVHPYIRYHSAKIGDEESLREARREAKDEPTPLRDAVIRDLYAPYMSDLRLMLESKEPKAEPLPISLGVATGLRRLIAGGYELPPTAWNELYEVWSNVIARAKEASA